MKEVSNNLFRLLLHMLWYSLTGQVRRFNGVLYNLWPLLPLKLRPYGRINMCTLLLLLLVSLLLCGSVDKTRLELSDRKMRRHRHNTDFQLWVISELGCVLTDWTWRFVVRGRRWWVARFNVSFLGQRKSTALLAVFDTPTSSSNLITSTSYTQNRKLLWPVWSSYNSLSRLLKNQPRT